MSRLRALAESIRRLPVVLDIVPGPTETRLAGAPPGVPAIASFIACMAAVWDRAGQPHITLTVAEAQAMATTEPRIDVTHDKVTRHRLGWFVLNSATVRDSWSFGP